MNIIERPEKAARGKGVNESQSKILYEENLTYIPIRFDASLF
jgi:hypothetical protein